MCRCPTRYMSDTRHVFNRKCQWLGAIEANISGNKECVLKLTSWDTLISYNCTACVLPSPQLVPIGAWKIQIRYEASGMEWNGMETSNNLNLDDSNTLSIEISLPRNIPLNLIRVCCTGTRVWSFTRVIPLLTRHLIERWCEFWSVTNQFLKMHAAFNQFHYCYSSIFSNDQYLLEARNKKQLNFTFQFDCKIIQCERNKLRRKKND